MNYEDELDELNEELDEELEDSCDADEPIDIPREDKIFNNRYNAGTGLSETDERDFSTKISVNDNYSDSYLKDIYKYEEVLDSKLILNTIFDFIQNDHEIVRLISKKSTEPFANKVKLAKDDLNFIFNRTHETLERKKEFSLFYSPIYVVEALSSISSIEYKKLFDMLDTEIQEILLIELNKKYQILDGKVNKKRIH